MTWNWNLGGAAAASICLFIGLGVAACADSGDGDGDGDGDGHVNGDIPEECEAISAVCHDVDSLSDRAAECHHIAHENVKEACVEAQAECASHCEFLAGAGGAGGEGGASSEDQ